MSRQGGLESEVALKVLRRDIDPRGQAVQRLRDEGRLLARLNHPSILRVYDLVVLEGRIALITEFVDGQDLSELFYGESRLGHRALIEVVGQIASALDAAWNAPVASGEGTLQLVHRDIKPSNIRVSRHGEVKVLDFGIARADSVGREARTQTNMMVGSPAYMAPERYLTVENRPESDIFSVGVTLYEGVAGARFFEGVPVPMLASLAVDEERYERWLEERLAVIQDVPPQIRRLLSEMLAYEPTDRPTAEALVLACDALADQLGGESLERFCRRHRWTSAPQRAGEFEGRTLAEDTEDLPAPSIEPAAPPSLAPSRVAKWIGLGLGVGGISIGAALAAVALALGGLWWWRAPPISQDLAEESVNLQEAQWADPVAPQVALAEGVEDPDGSTAAPDPSVGSTASQDPSEGVADPVEPAAKPSPVSRPAPPPSPRPTSETRAPAPASAPASPPPIPPEFGRVSLGGDAEVELLLGDERYALPADVPAGLYGVFVHFEGREPMNTGNFRVRGGESHHVECRSRMVRCDYR